MKYVLSLVVIALFSILFYGVYKSNESFVTTTAYYCLGICMGRIAFKIAGWLHKYIFKDKEEK